MKLTNENLHALGTAGAGFNRKQLELLGVSWPPRRGWLADLVGNHIDPAVYNQAMGLKGATTAKRMEYQAKRQSTASAGNPAAKQRAVQFVSLVAQERIKQNLSRQERRQMRTQRFIRQYLTPGVDGSNFKTMLRQYKKTDKARVAVCAARMSYNDFLGTQYWRLIAAQTKLEARGMCQICASRGPLDAHHRSYECRGVEIETYQTEIVALCRPCHAKHHNVMPVP